MKVNFLGDLSPPMHSVVLVPSAGPSIHGGLKTMTCTVGLKSVGLGTHGGTLPRRQITTDVIVAWCLHEKSCNRY